MQAFMEIRSQKSRGSSANKFGGPDTYFCVQLVPAGAKRLKCLNRNVARKRGITLIYCGEGYSRRKQTNRSMYNKAKHKAFKIVEAINS